MQKFSRLLFATTAAAVFLVSGCATYKPVGFNKAASGNLKVVAIAPVGLPEKPAVWIVAPAGSSFGLIGALIDESVAASARARLAKTLDSVQFDARAELRAALNRELATLTFSTREIAAGGIDADRTAFLKKLPDSGDAQAVLDLYAVNFGYFAAGATTDYRPVLTLAARLSEIATGKVLFEDQISYNTVGPPGKAITLEPDEKYRFKNQDVLNADPALAVAGLKDAIAKVAIALAKQF